MDIFFPFCIELNTLASAEAGRLATTANVTPKTTNSNSLLPSTASNDIQQHVNSANSGDVDIRNLELMIHVFFQRYKYFLKDI
jgi:hypothetical protein